MSQKQKEAKYKRKNMEKMNQEWMEEELCVQSREGTFQSLTRVWNFFLNHAINFAIWQNLKLAISCLMNPLAM